MLPGALPAAPCSGVFVPPCLPDLRVDNLLRCDDSHGRNMRYVDVLCGCAAHLKVCTVFFEVPSDTTAVALYVAPTCPATIMERTLTGDS